MAWFEFHQSLIRHPKTTTAVARLEVDRFKFIGHLATLWSWALDIADKDGRLPPSCSAEILAEAAGWPLDDADRFIDALLTAGGSRPGFLERKRDRFVLHDWYQYAGKLAEYRDRNRKKQKNFRDRQRGSDGATDPDADSNRDRLRNRYAGGDVTGERGRGRGNREGQEENREGEGSARAQNGARPLPSSPSGQPSASGSPSPSPEPQAWDWVHDVYSRNIGEIDQAARTEMRGWLAKVPADWVIAAINEATAAKEPGFGYVKRTIESCIKENRPPASLGRSQRLGRRNR